VQPPNRSALSIITASLVPPYDEWPMLVKISDKISGVPEVAAGDMQATGMPVVVAVSRGPRRRTQP